MLRNFFKVKLKKNGEIKIPKTLVNYLNSDSNILYLVPTNGIIQITNTSKIFIPIMKKEKELFIFKYE